MPTITGRCDTSYDYRDKKSDDSTLIADHALYALERNGCCFTASDAERCDCAAAAALYQLRCKGDDQATAD
jgi:hypothetical protein